VDGRKVHRTDQAFEAIASGIRILLVDGWRSARITWRQLE
jgi:hypothetical protein